MAGEISKDVFLAMARDAGVDMRDPAYLDALYGDVCVVLGMVAVLDEADIAGVEPAATFGTGYGAPGKQQMGRSG